MTNPGSHDGQLRIFLGLLAIVGCLASCSAAEPIDRGFEIARLGKPVAVIIKADVSENPRVIKDAANELRYHLERATGANLPILREREWIAMPNRNETSIHVGVTSSSKSAGVDVSQTRPNGFVT